MTYPDFVRALKVSHPDRRFVFWAGPEPTVNKMREVYIHGEEAFLFDGPFPLNFDTWGAQLFSEDGHFVSAIGSISESAFDYGPREKVIEGFYSMLSHSLESIIKSHAPRDT